MTSLSNIFVIYEASLMRFKAQNLEHHYVFLVLKYEKITLWSSRSHDHSPKIASLFHHKNDQKSGADTGGGGFFLVAPPGVALPRGFFSTPYGYGEKNPMGTNMWKNPISDNL